ncbi:hypothetical protein RJ639_020228 [Escallonia herrerae]|uniref:Retrotransposon Copia-like N-terminal domain-containing protein n=1 Tax=Escallonia herrerae TaxID=1293975 RepID=A0AA88VBA0_9ASTE|nr:hypothetical protein RJ639_020228 [Escallonia herrerae]
MEDEFASYVHGGLAPVANVQNIAIDTKSPFYLHPFDHPCLIFVTQPLSENGENYFTWRRNMLTALQSKNKAGFVDGLIAKPDVHSRDFQSWIQCNAVAFTKGSPLVPEMSREIAKLREEGKLMELEKKWFKSESTLLPRQGGSVTTPKILDLQSFGGLFLISGISSALALLICLLYLVKEKLHAKYFIIRFLGGGKLATMISYLIRRNANAIGEVNA